MPPLPPRPVYHASTEPFVSRRSGHAHLLPQHQKNDNPGRVPGQMKEIHMKLGPNQIVACPHCGALAHYRTLVSGNTFGAVVWTDGRQYAQMMVEPPAVVKCHACAKCYWLTDAKEIGVVARDFRAKEPVPEAWSKAPEVKEPSADEYLDAIEAGLAKDRAQEKSLRLLAWWRANDPSREWRFAAEATRQPHRMASGGISGVWPTC